MFLLWRDRKLTITVKSNKVNDLPVNNNYVLKVKLILIAYFGGTVCPQKFSLFGFCCLKLQGSVPKKRGQWGNCSHNYLFWPYLAVLLFQASPVDYSTSRPEIPQQNKQRYNEQAFHKLAQEFLWVNFVVVVVFYFSSAFSVIGYLTPECKVVYILLKIIRIFSRISTTFS